MQMDSKLKLLQSLIDSNKLKLAERIYLELESAAKLNSELIPQISPYYYRLIELRFKLAPSRMLIPWLILSTGAISCFGWIALIFSFQLGFRIWMGIWIALMVHELSHFISAHMLFGIRNLAISGLVLGLVPDLERELRAHPGSRLMVFSCGSLANLILGILLGIRELNGMINLVVGLGNLVPMGRGIKMSDGMQILRELKILIRILRKPKPLIKLMEKSEAGNLELARE